MHRAWQRVQSLAASLLARMLVRSRMPGAVVVAYFAHTEDDSLLGGARPYTLHAYARSRWRVPVGWA